MAGANDPDFAKAFTENWPGVNTEAVEKETGAGDPWKDADGAVFDPELHVWDKENDKPKFTQKGKFKKRPRKKSKSQESETGSFANTEAAKSKEVNEHGARQAAEITMHLIGMAGQYMAPDHPAFTKDESGQDEYTTGVEAYRACYEYYGVDYIPPYLAPVIWTMSYFGRRIRTSNKAQGKLAAAWMYVKTRLFKRRKKRNARNDNGDDGERQDNAS